MKLKMGLMGLMGVMVICGCGQKPDPHIANLEARVVAVEARVAETEAGHRDLYGRFTNLCAIVREGNATNQAMTVELTGLALEAQKNWDEIVRAVAELQTALTNPGPRNGGKFLPPQAAPSRQVVVMKEGVPVEVYNRIAADAVKKWGSDFEMQEFTIRNQIEAYRKLHP